MEGALVVPVKKPLACLSTEILKQATVYKDYVVSILTRRTLAGALKCSLKTVTRNLQQMEQQKLITFESRTGQKGGIVIKFNPEKFDFPQVDNPLSNPTKSDEQLINSLLPKKPAYKPTGKRRTAREMGLYRAQILLGKDKESQYNKYLQGQAFTGMNWDFFEKTDNPKDNYRAWIVGQIFTAYVNAYNDYYFRMRQKQVKDGVPRADQRGFWIKPPLYDCLKTEFFGTRNWTYAKKLANYCKVNHRNPVSFIGSVFSWYEFNHLNFNTKHPVPQFSTTTSAKGIEIYLKARHNQMDNVIGTKDVPYDSKGWQSITALKSIWNNIDSGVKTIHTQTLDKYLESKDKRVLPYVNFYNDTLKNAKEMLSDDELGTLKYFLRVQLGIVFGTLPSYVSLGIPEVEVSLIKAKDMLKGHPNLLMKGIEHLTHSFSFDPTISEYWTAEDYKQKQIEDVGNMYASLFCEDRSITRQVTQVDLQKNSQYVNMHTVLAVVKKAQKLLPLNSLGMLDRNTIKEKF